MDFLLIQIALGSLCAFLFQFRNPDRNGMQFTSLFIVFIFVSIGVIPVANWGWVIAAIAGIGLIVSYSTRFAQKIKRTFLSYVKFAAMILLALYPLPSLVPAYGKPPLLFFTLTAIEFLTLPALAALYIYDRIIIMSREMNKKTMISIAIYTLVTLSALTYAFIQKAEADMQRQLAAEQSMIEVKNNHAMRIEIQYLKEQLERRNGQIDSLRKAIVLLSR